MNTFNSKYDVIIIGAGITGLAVARELISRNSDTSVLILEKESGLGFHSSGRNSGVLHSGIYYKEDSLKAKFCAEGSRLMSEYCRENDLSLAPIGKVIVPTREEDDPQVDLLMKRAQLNGAKEVSVIDEKELNRIEPFTRTASGRALYSPKTSVVNPKEILNHLKLNLEKSSVKFSFGEKILECDQEKKLVETSSGQVEYSHLYNTAGQNSDIIAKSFKIAKDFTMLPFKGLYYKLRTDSLIKFNGLVYPVPDLNVPFLGVHTVKSADGQNYFGPTAIPAFGRENYQGFQGISLSSMFGIFGNLLNQYWHNNQGFRNYAHAEAGRFFKSKFVQAANALVPNLKASDLIPCDKVGIRTQLLNKKTHELVMDFMVERLENSTHVLNVVSPGFTSSFSFAKFIVDQEER